MTIQVPIPLGYFELCTYKHVNRNVVAQDEVNFNMGNNNIQLIHSGIDQSLTAVSLVSSSETTFAYARPDCTGWFRVVVLSQLCMQLTKPLAKLQLLAQVTFGDFCHLFTAN